MKLHRIASISFGENVENVTNIRANIGNVEIETNKAAKGGEETDWCLVFASVEIQEALKLDPDGYVVVPETERKECEDAIEKLANRLSVFGRTRRSISSISPCVAFSEPSNKELVILNASNGFGRSQKSNVSTSFTIDISDYRYHDALADRPVGVALLAETFSTSHAVAKYREYVRFFENAFARPFSQIEKILFQFLEGANLGYARDEIHDWIEPRDGATHADMRKSKILVFEPEIRPMIGRIEQAAYDVLFNKEHWHDPSRSRRTVLRHLAATDGRLGDLKVVQGAAPTIQFQVMDSFGVYPLNLAGGLTQAPGGWWHEPKNDSPSTDSGQT